MRTLAIFTLVLLGSTVSSFGQKIEVFTGELRSNIFSNPPVEVPEGKILEVVDFFTTKPRTAQPDDGLAAVLETQPAEGELQLLRARSWDGASPGGLLERTVKFVGPLNLRVQADVGSHVKFYLYYRLIDNADSASLQTSQAVVIPEEEDGDVEIILESSKDLITWTAANPGVYNAKTTDQRFFRVRAVKK